MNGSQGIFRRFRRLCLRGGFRVPENGADGVGDRGICRMVRPKSQADQGPAVRHQPGLPAVVRLIFLHGNLGLRVPLSGGCAFEVILLDQCVLNFDCPAGVNGPLAMNAGDLLALLRRSHPGMSGCRRAMRSAAKGGSNSQVRKATTKPGRLEKKACIPRLGGEFSFSST